jgi:ADP-heptose:LPS heptosyltransferase
VRRVRPTVVVLRALGLGDFLTGVPALRALRAAFPGHRLTLAAPAALAPLARLSGAVHEVVPADPLAPLPARLRGAAVAVNLHGRGPQSHGVLFALRPHELLWFAHERVPASEDAPRWRAGEHEVHRWCRLLEEHGIPAEPRDLRLPAPRQSGPEEWRGTTVIHPGAGDPARVWPAGRWVEIARVERSRGRRVVLTGSGRESAVAGLIASKAGLAPGSVLAGRTDLDRLAKLVACAGRVVSSDTGIAHLATALGTPSVTLFGAVPPAEWGPIVDRQVHPTLWAGHGRHVADVPAEDVIAALESLPGR